MRQHHRLPVDMCNSESPFSLPGFVGKELAGNEPFAAAVTKRAIEAAR